MHSRMMEQVARQRTDEMRGAVRPCRAQRTRRSTRNPIRHQAGWALVEIGLRLANDPVDK
jgi:hypothetical protein